MSQHIIMYVLLAIVGILSVVILFYFFRVIRMSMQSPDDLLYGRRPHPTSIRGRAARPRHQPRAMDNLYVARPVDDMKRLGGGMVTRDIVSTSGHATLALPASIFLDSSRGLTINSDSHVEGLRFYTPAELMSFSFDDPPTPRATSPDPTNNHNPLDVPSMDGHGNARHPSSVHSNNLSADQPSMFIRPEIFLGPTVSTFHQSRSCYSIPASYIGRPPAYLPGEGEPPSYADALRRGQSKDKPATP